MSLTSARAERLVSRRSRIPALLLAAFSVLSVPAWAGVVSPIADSFVRDGTYAANNFGTANPLEVKTEVASYNRDAYLKFDLSGEGAITSAVLTFYGALDTTGVTIKTDVYSAANSGWAEGGITWNNRPARGTLIGSLNTTGTTYAKYSVDVTSFVKTEKAAGRNQVTLALHNAVSSNIRLFVRSKEDGISKPTLTMTSVASTPAPQPTATPAPGPSATPAPSGINYYVSTSGSDSNNGSASSPWRTISKAVNTVRGGGTQSAIIHVAPGTYSETVYIPSSFSGTSTARSYLVSDVKWGAKITNGSQYTVENVANHVTIQDFDVTGNSRIGIYNHPSVGFVKTVGNRVHDITGTGCGDSGGAGILNDYWNGGKYMDTIGNHIFNVGPTSCNTVHGIYHSTQGGLIQNNIVGRISGWGIHLWHAATDVTITNNTVFNASSGGIVVGAGDSPGGVTAANCRVNNNIVRDSNYSIYEYGAVSGSNSYANNLIFNTNYGIQLSGKSASGTINADPQFVNYLSSGTGDYHLRSTSPAINSGTSNLAPATDFEGFARPYGGAWDRGALEYH